MEELLNQLVEPLREKAFDFTSDPKNILDVLENGAAKSLQDFIDSDTDGYLFGKVKLENEKHQEIVLKAIEIIQRQRKQQVDTSTGISPELLM
jgi:hypothetical protein